MNEQNLIKFNEMDIEQQRELAIKGGKTSGEVRRKNRTMREIANLILSTEENDVNKECLKKYGIECATIRDSIVYQLITDYKKDKNYKALDTLLDIIGEKAPQQIDLQGQMVMAITDTEKEIERLMEDDGTTTKSN